MIVTACRWAGIRIMENEKFVPHKKAARIIACTSDLLAHAPEGLSMRVPAKWRQFFSRYLELDLLAGIFVFAAAIFTFLKLVSEMREGETRSADQAHSFGPSRSK